MSAKPSAELIQQYLNRICENRSFEKSPRNVRLLKFLVDKAIDNKDVNEYVVGLELFEKNYDPDKNDSKVRVYMFNLRKKLNEYYNSSGSEDALQFIIEKGQYNLKFEQTGNESTETISDGEDTQPKKSGKKRLLYWSILIIIAIMLVIGGVSVSLKKEYCWATFFNGQSNICVVADHTIVWYPYGSRLIPSMEEGINSHADYISFLQRNPNDSIRLANYTLLSKMAPFSVKVLSKWFWKNNSDFELRLESQYAIDEIRDNNLLYIGQFKTMSTSKSLFLNHSKEFKIRDKQNGFTVLKEGKQFGYFSNFKDGTRKDYAMVSYMPLENGKKALFFVSNNDIGVMGTVSNFTNKEWLTEFYTQLETKDSYFNALFEVSGLQRTETSCKLIHIELLEY